MRLKSSWSSDIAAALLQRVQDVAVISMMCTALFAALLLSGVACASAFDFSELPDELVDALKDQVGCMICARPCDGSDLASMVGLQHETCSAADQLEVAAVS